MSATWPWLLIMMVVCGSVWASVDDCLPDRPLNKSESIDWQAVQLCRIANSFERLERSLAKQ